MALGYQKNLARAEETRRRRRQRRRQGGGASPMELADEASIERFFATVDRDLGPIDGLVNSAGIIGPHGRIDAVEARR